MTSGLAVSGQPLFLFGDAFLARGTVARKRDRSPQRRAVSPALEPMADHDEFTGRASRSFVRYGQLDFSRPVILGYRFERAQKIPPVGRDLPSLVIAKYVAAAENIDGRNPRRQTLEPRAPVTATGGQDDNVPFERNKRGSAVAVTSQDLQNSNLYAHAYAFGPQRFLLFCAVVKVRIYCVAVATVQQPRPVIRSLDAARQFHLTAHEWPVATVVMLSPGFRTRHRSAACHRTASPSDPSST
jgi:hypothetical protein